MLRIVAAIQKALPLAVAILAGLVLFANNAPEALAGEYKTYTTLAGPVESPGAVDGTASVARFHDPSGVAVDLAGNVYVADTGNSVVRKISPAGEVTTLAGLAPNQGLQTDGRGHVARFGLPGGVAVDPNGNVYVANTSKQTIRKITPAGIVTTVAGSSGIVGSADGTGGQARFYWPFGIAVDANGIIYVADSFNHTIRKISPTGEVSTLAGMAGQSGSGDGVGADARFFSPEGIALDAGGNVYVGDTGNGRIRKITPAGVVTTLAGVGSPRGLAVDVGGNVYVANTEAHTVSKITPAGVVSTLAGLSGVYGSEDGAGNAARFLSPKGVALDLNGNVYVADTGNNLIRKITPAGVVSTLAGLAGSVGSADGVGGAARFRVPQGVAVDSSRNVYVADRANYTVRKITPIGEVTTFAGLAQQSGSADGTGSNARFAVPCGVAVDASDNVLVADTGNHTIRRITPAGVVTTLAGLAGNSGDVDGTGTDARFDSPTGLVVGPDGNIYVADSANGKVRKVTPAGVVTTLATAAGVRIAADAAGNLYMTHPSQNVIRKVTSAGDVSVFAGSLGSSGSIDGTGSAAYFNGPSGIAVDSAGAIYVTDAGNHTIRKITAAGEVTTVAGTASLTSSVYTAGNDPGTDGYARFDSPCGIAVDTNGSLYVADQAVHAIRIGAAGIADTASIDQAAGSLGALRQLDAAPQTASSWQWSIIRRPAGSTATLSSSTVRNPTFTPDVADLYRFRLVATDAAGKSSITTVDLTVTGSAIVASAGPGGSISPSGVVWVAQGEGQSFAITPGANYAIAEVLVDGVSVGVVSSYSFANVVDNHTIVACFREKPLAMGRSPLTPDTLAGADHPVRVRDGVAEAARFFWPRGLVVRASGDIYVAQVGCVRKISNSAVVTTLAGFPRSSGASSVDGRGGAASFGELYGAVADSSGNIYASEYEAHVVRRIALDGTVTTFAGSPGVSGSANGAGAAARFLCPQGMAIDSADNIYLADCGNHTIRKITPAGDVSTVAGAAGVAGYVDGAAPDARFKWPRAVAVDGAGNLYVTDSGNAVIRKISTLGAVSTIAGSAGNRGSADGQGGDARFYSPTGIAVDGAGDLYVSDCVNNTVRKITAAGEVTTVAGLAGSSGWRDGVGVNARFCDPAGLALDGSGNLYIAEFTNCTIRKMTPAGTVTTVAGSHASHGSQDGIGRQAQFYYPKGVAVDNTGNLFVADGNNHTIRKVTPAGETSTLAGLAGAWGTADGVGDAARFNSPQGVAVDVDGNVFVADTENNRIRKISAVGVVTTYAGSSPGFFDGPCIDARFDHPTGVTVDNAGNVYVADSNNLKVRKISTEGAVTTLATLWASPKAVAVDNSGNVLVACTHVVFRVTPLGEISALVGETGAVRDGLGDRAGVGNADGIAVDTDGNVYVSDSDAIRHIGAIGLVRTVLGNEAQGATAFGSGGETRAGLIGVAADPGGRVYVLQRGPGALLKATPGVAASVTIDQGNATVGEARQLNVVGEETTAWDWTLVRRPTGSSATLSSNSARNPTFTPDVADIFTFRVVASAANGRRSVTTVDLVTTGAHHAPVASNKNLVTDYDTCVIFQLDATDADGDAPNYWLVSWPEHGVLEGRNGSWIYYPEAGYVGTDSFMFRATDGHLNSNVATVSITITAPNHAPQISSFSPANPATVAVGATQAFSVEAWDSDGDALTYAWKIDGENVPVVTDTLSYSPVLADIGSHTLVVTISDGRGGTIAQTWNVTVPNTAPVADAQAVTTAEDVAKVVTLTGSDAEGAVLAFAVVVGPAHGALSGTGATRTYTPSADYNGPDSFTFKVNDGLLDSPTATVSITVTEESDAPVANAQSVSTAVNVAKAITLVATDADGDDLTYAIVAGPAHGTLSGGGASQTYTPVAGYSGADSFTFKANDGAADSNVATVSITVSGASGAVKVWGYNNSGQLGLGTTTTAKSPAAVPGLSGVASLAAGEFHTLAVMADGTVMAWGANKYGQLGDGTLTGRKTPVAIAMPGGLKAVAAAAGQYHSVALLENGTVAVWGYNAHGELGLGTTVTVKVPTINAHAGLAAGVTAVAAGRNHTLALLNGGGVMAWGYNNRGQLGNNSTTTSKVPAAVRDPTGLAPLSGVAAISAGGYHSMALVAGGEVRAWGYNATGQLGDGTVTNRKLPVAVSGLSGVSAVNCGLSHTLALLGDGSARAWGANKYGQLGNNSTVTSKVPVVVSGLAGVSRIASGLNHNLVLLTDGTVKVWGYNSYGQLGLGTTTLSKVPVTVPGLSGGAVPAAGGSQSMVVTVP